MELLDKAHNDIAREEDDPPVRGLRDRALHHIDEAHRIVDHLIVQAASLWKLLFSEWGHGDPGPSMVAERVLAMIV
jgi:hypothetical protein